jgi:hypothetical protein
MKKLLFLTLILAICCIFIAKTGICSATTLFSDNFDSYETGALGTQNNWEWANNSATIRNDIYNSPPNSISFGTQTIARHIFTAQSSGTFKGKIYFDLTTTEFNFYLGSDTTPKCQVYIDTQAGKVYSDIYIYTPAELLSFNFSLDTWYDFYFRFDSTGSVNQFCLENICSEWVACRYGGLQTFTTLNKLNFKGADSSNSTSALIDDVFISDSITPDPAIFISTPTTATTITNNSTNLTGGWTTINPDIYHSITLYFNSNFIGEQSVAKIIPITSSTGSFSIPLTDFGITANGQWNLKGSATYANTQLSDMYITPDLISPTGYNLIFDVAGFHTPYTFTDFDTWYGDNVSNYGTPSAWASGMVGFLQPILEKIAEFGARVQDYLDTSKAYQQGSTLGSVFPVVNAYILKINIFFGGFPIAQFFQWGILIMMGIFAVKMILKLLSFIPFIGGSG